MGKGKDDESAKECLAIGGVVVVAVGLLLMLILVPLHFSYIERNHIGFKKNTATNTVDRTQYHGPGRYAWGVGKVAVQFPTTWQKHRFTDLTVFTDAGEIRITVTFMYRIQPQHLADMYNAFGSAYHSRIISIAQAELRNGASNFTTASYQNNRTGVTDGLFAALAQRLPSTAYVTVSRDRFYLEEIHLPETVQEKKTQIFLNDQLRITQLFNKTAAQTRLETLANVSRIRARARLVSTNASTFGNTLRENAASEAFRLVQQEVGLHLASIKTNLTLSSAATESLVKFNTLLDVNTSFTLLSGVTGAVLSAAP